MTEKYDKIPKIKNMTRRHKSNNITNWKRTNNMFFFFLSFYQKKYLNYMSLNIYVVNKKGYIY